MTKIGIDFGLTGAIAVRTNRRVRVYDIPVYEIKRGKHLRKVVDIPRLLELCQMLATLEPEYALGEDITSMPGDGGVGLAAFLRCVGNVEACFTAAGIPLRFVHPARWKTRMHLSKDKEVCRAAASRAMPESAGQWPLKKHHNRAEAALLTEYADRFGADA